MKQASKLHRTASERGEPGNPEAEKKHTQASKIYFMSRRMSDKAKERDNEAKRKEFVKEDLYDIILSHLLDEGYADTEQAAEAIMANMSEDWRESIVGEVLDEELSGSRKGKASEILNRKLRDVETLRNLAGRKRTQKTDYGSGNKAARKAGKEVKDSRVVQSDN